MTNDSRHQQEEYFSEQLKNALRGDREAVKDLLDQFINSTTQNEDQYKAVNIFVCGAINRILSGVNPVEAFRLTNPSHRPPTPEEKYWSYAAAVLVHEKRDRFTRPEAKDEAAMIMEADIRAIERALQKYEKEISHLSIDELEALI